MNTTHERCLPAKLLRNEHFSQFYKEFSSKERYETVKMYIALNKEKLRIELAVLYERNEFSKISGALKLHQFILRYRLQNSLSEMNCLLKIIVTISMTLTEPECNFDT